MYDGSCKLAIAIPVTITFQKNLPIPISYLFSFPITITTKTIFSLMKNFDFSFMQLEKKIDLIKIKKANRYKIWYFLLIKYSKN